VDLHHALGHDPVPVAEVPFFKYLFRRKPDVSAGLTKLDSELRAVLRAEARIQLVDASVSDNWFPEHKCVA